MTLREVDRYQRLPVGLPEVIAMLKYISTGFIVSLAVMGTACGSSDDDGGGLVSATTGSGATGSGATGTGGSGTPVDLGGSSNSGGSGGTSVDDTHDGGLVDLTPEEVGSLGDAACAGWAAEPEGGDPAVLQFVVDTSLSMSLAPGQDSGGGFGQPGGGGGQGGPTKWEITRDALVEAIGELPDTMPVGLFFYPNRANENSETPLPLEACVNTDEGIAVDVLSEQHRGALQQALGAAEPNGWTPTHGAYRHALQTSLIPADFPGQKFMVLITDGLPTLTLECMGDVDNGGGFGGGGMPQPVDSQPIVDEISLAREDAGVRTFLIGSPGSEGGREWMSEAAILGATAAAGCRLDGEPYCHMDMTTAPDFSAALRAGLRQIRQTVLSCSYDFPEPPDGQVINADTINLIVTTGSGQSQLVRPDENGECTEGWQVIDDQIVLCADTCDRIQNDPGSRLNLLFGCESGVVPPVK